MRLEPSEDVRGRRLSLRVAVPLALLLSVAPGAARAQPAPSPGQNASAEGLTQTLLALQARYQSAAPAEREQMEAELLSVAASRQRVLGGLVEKNPAAVLRVALPAGLRSAFPPAVQVHIEEEMEIEGTLLVLHEDRDGGSRYLYFLEAGGERFSLHFAADQPALLTGSRVRVKGLRVGGALVLASGKTDLQVL